MKKKPLEYALYLLELRDRSVKEIERKMTEKEYSSEDIHQTIKFLLDKNFLDDKRFARNFIKQLQYRSQGRYKIRFALQKFGLERELIETELKTINEEDEYQSALELGENLIQKKKIEPEKKYEKVGRFLAGRGYSIEVVKKVLQELI